MWLGWSGVRVAGFSLMTVVCLATLEGSSCRVPEAVVTVLCTPDVGCLLGHVGRR